MKKSILIALFSAASLWLSAQTDPRLEALLPKPVSVKAGQGRVTLASPLTIGYSDPALKSIALITVIGLSTVLLTSFVVQPLLYNFLILNRRYRRLTPYTALNLWITFVGFLVFSIGSLFFFQFTVLVAHHFSDFFRSFLVRCAVATIIRLNA